MARRALIGRRAANPIKSPFAARLAFRLQGRKSNWEGGRWLQMCHWCCLTLAFVPNPVFTPTNKHRYHPAGDRQTFASDAVWNREDQTLVSASITIKFCFCLCVHSRLSSRKEDSIKKKKEKGWGTCVSLLIVAFSSTAPWSWLRAVCRCPP